MIDALLAHLPAPGDVFAPADRKLWVDMIELAFKLIYDEEPPPPEGEQPHGGQT